MSIKKYQLGQVANIFTGFPFDGSKYNEISGTRVVRGENVTVGELRWDTTKYWINAFKEQHKYELREGDIVIGMDGSRVGRNRAQVKKLDLPLLLAQRVACLRANPNFDQNFLAYVIKSKIFEQYVNSVKTGTSIPHISAQQIKEFEFLAPPLEEQRRIASILTALDDKIELNRRMNETLEGIAGALWEEWFGKYVRDGVEKTNFETHLDVERGLSYKGDGLVGPDDGGMPMYNLNSILEGGGFKYAGLKYYTGEFKERHLVHPGELIVTNTEQGHKYMLIGYPAVIPKMYGSGICSHHIYRVRMKPDSYLTTQFFYYLMMHPIIREQIVGCANGTTVNMLKMDGLKVPEFFLPPQKMVENFSVIAQQNWDKQEENFKEITTLTHLRDTLLPRLMGEHLR